VSNASALYGGERSLLEIVNVMGPAWRPVFVVPQKGPYSAALDEANYPYEVVPVPHGPQYSRRWFLRVLQLAWVIRRQRPSLVHANLQWAVPLVAAASRISGVPFVAHLRNMISGPLDEREKKYFGNAAAVICISHAVKSAACDAGILPPEKQDRIWIIPDARDLSKYIDGNRARIRAELGVSDDVALIGMIARIDPMKGQHLFLDAAALIAEKMPRVHFVLAGDLMNNRDDYLEMLRRRCDDAHLKNRVSFLGYRRDVPDILAALDCFVHPSSRGAFVSVLIEAMATGIPIVVPDLDGIPECVGREGAAELMSTLQPLDWANAVIQIIKDPRRRARMALEGRERAKCFEALYLAHETEKVFENCCCEKLRSG
jgi:glycosyltransferase involved in cell wall biosynthesis